MGACRRAHRQQARRNDRRTRPHHRRAMRVTRRPTGDHQKPSRLPLVAKNRQAEVISRKPYERGCRLTPSCRQPDASLEAQTLCKGAPTSKNSFVRKAADPRRRGEGRPRGARRTAAPFRATELKECIASISTKRTNLPLPGRYTAISSRLLRYARLLHRRFDRRRSSPRRPPGS